MRKGLTSAVLLHNARWFTHVRWIVVLVFVLVGLTGNLIPDILANFGIIAPVSWPWILAGILASANLFFCYSVGRLNEQSPSGVVERNVWLQIVTDLIIVTVLVHIAGSTDTFIAFTYLFHIVLACIFFPPRSSFAVALLAGALYLACVILETIGVLPVSSILATPVPVHLQGLQLNLVFAGSAVFVWFVVWYLISTLSESVRNRDQQLSEANERLIKADQEKNRLVLITTHDLKAPFSGIESNIQLLKFVHGDKLPDEVKEIVDRIARRSEALRTKIKDILLLGGLKEEEPQEKTTSVTDIALVIDEVAEELEDKAHARDISLHIDVLSTNVPCEKRQLIPMFANLLANAVFYSKDGGQVDVKSVMLKDSICISVSDHGIGIKEEYLPHIFDEYYRAPDAAAYNHLSTGLGLAIVRQVAKKLELSVRVSSEQGIGTTFEVTLPLARRAKNATAKETQDDQSEDC